MMVMMSCCSRWSSWPWRVARSPHCWVCWISALMWARRLSSSATPLRRLKMSTEWVLMTSLCFKQVLDHCTIYFIDYISQDVFFFHPNSFVSNSLNSQCILTDLNSIYKPCLQKHSQHWKVAADWLSIAKHMLPIYTVESSELSTRWILRPQVCAFKPQKSDLIMLWANISKPVWFQEIVLFDIRRLSWLSL